MQLPPGARVWQAGGHDAAWTPESHLLAEVVDLLAGANWQRGGSKGPKPKPAPRPKQIAERRTVEQRHLEQAQRMAERNRARAGG